MDAFSTAGGAVDLENAFANEADELGKMINLKIFKLMLR